MFSNRGGRLLDEGGHAFLLVLGGDMAWKTRRSNRTPSASVVSKARLTASLAIIAIGSDMAAIVSAAFSASSISWSAATTRETSPALGLLGVHHARPVRHMSIALALPTARVSRCEPPIPG